jgi:hypothetical protein
MHVKLAGAVALAGFVFTSRPWIGWINTLGPEAGLIVKNIIIFIVIYILNIVDDVIGPPRRQALGYLLMFMAFNIIFNYQSEWIEDLGATNVDRQTPDGAIYHRARGAGLRPDAARIVTFVLAPFLLFTIGSFMLRNGQKLNLD